MWTTEEIHVAHGKACLQCSAMMLPEEIQTIDLQKLSNQTWQDPPVFSCQWQSCMLEVDTTSGNGA